MGPLTLQVKTYILPITTREPNKMLIFYRAPARD